MRRKRVQGQQENRKNNNKTTKPSKKVEQQQDPGQSDNENNKNNEDSSQSDSRTKNKNTTGPTKYQYVKTNVKKHNKRSGLALDLANIFLNNSMVNLDYFKTLLL